MNVEADTRYTLSLAVQFAESQEIDTTDPAWLGKLLSGRLARGEVVMDDIHWRLASDVAAEDVIHYGIGTGWQYAR